MFYTLSYLKVSGIAVDLYFDHLLAKKWGKYHSKPLTNFVSDFFKFNDLNTKHYSNDFLSLLTYIENGNWITNYKTLDGLDFACRGLSKRISFENELKNGVSFFENNKEIIEKTFYVFMKDAIGKFN